MGSYYRNNENVNRLRNGEFQKDIAADYGITAKRVSYIWSVYKEPGEELPERVGNKSIIKGANK